MPRGWKRPSGSERPCEGNAPDANCTCRLEHPCALRKRRASCHHIIHHQNRLAANQHRLRHGKGALHILATVFLGKATLPRRRTDPSKKLSATWLLQPGGQRRGEIIRLIVPAQPAMAPGRGNGGDELDLIYLKTRARHPFQPISKVRPQPEMAVELEIQEHPPRITIETQGRGRTVEMRPINAAILTQELHIQLLHVTPALTTTPASRHKRQAVETIRTDIAPGTVYWPGAGLAKAGPDEV